ncbi:MAG TPA: hypothetical protein VM938_12800 [Acidimicrobiales bacterium]|nr:hypothetical protein [Acidimicrobiales bacterium]
MKTTLLSLVTTGTLAAALVGISVVDGDTPTKVLGDVIVQQGKPGPPNSGGNNPGGGNNTGGPAEFAVDGGITGLFPGASRGIDLTISNPYAFAIKVTDVSARVKQSSNAACPVGSLTFEALRNAPVVVPARGTAAATLPVRMRPEAANVCAGLTFTLSYSAQAVQA